MNQVLPVRTTSPDTPADDPRRWLANTPLLQFDHPKIRLLGVRLGQLKASPREKAVACFNHLRSLPFGCIADSTGTSALSVLKAGMGDCHTKSTLLIALLRSQGIPARLRFVTLAPDFLHGIIDVGGQPIEHGYTEVFLDGRWHAVDSYVVDVRLAMAAKTRLQLEGRLLGYGMHREGLVSWDGKGDSFAQFAPHEQQGAPLHDWGAFDDPYQFYSSVDYVRERLSLSSRFKWLVAARVVNRRVRELRSTPVPRPG
ncbi:transglutaminase-like domain-containing protein [Caenimonas aquaedulcis]|uniref:Transglutaminase domain-containing protein n=1 Tax=Caenimonas aquaedulcis TaxID=2793270 RepID=A0A931MIT0_9BURK|nr:transglutaminase-like domain-containing protein [Caenimonas aquaedulcis]MBG9389585.1 transglutaminase domain-containing protein [Caenimonas aquaedulcis]